MSRVMDTAAERANSDGTVLDRAAWALIALASWAVLLVAAWLNPDSRGFGTHEQLGLAPCGFTRATGIVCPGCGLTTSFANMAHGHIVRAFVSHPMGPLLFALVFAAAAYAPFAVVRARSFRTVFENGWIVVAFALTATSGLITFGLRIGHVLAVGH